VLNRNALWQIWLPGNKKTFLGLQVNFPIFLSDFNQTRASSTVFSESLQYFTDTHPVGAALILVERTDRRTWQSYRCFSRLREHGWKVYAFTNSHFWI